MVLGMLNICMNHYGIKQEAEIFVPKDDNVKVNLLKLKNETPRRRKLKMVYYLKPVLGEDELKTNGQINLEFDKDKDVITMKNLNAQDIDETVYIYSSEKILSYTGNNDSIQINKKEKLNNENSLIIHVQQ